jgi:hypothetical protein
MNCIILQLEAECLQMCKVHLSFLYILIMNLLDDTMFSGRTFLSILGEGARATHTTDVP